MLQFQVSHELYKHNNRRIFIRRWTSLCTVILDLSDRGWVLCVEFSQDRQGKWTKVFPMFRPNIIITPFTMKLFSEMCGNFQSSTRNNPKANLKQCVCTCNKRTRQSIRHKQTAHVKIMCTSERTMPKPFQSYPSQCRKGTLYCTH